MASAFGGAGEPAALAADGFRAGAFVATRFAAAVVLAPDRFGAAAVVVRFRGAGFAARRRTVLLARAAFEAGRFRAADLRAARFCTGFFADVRARPVRPAAAFRRLVPAAFRLAIMFPFVTRNSSGPRRRCYLDSFR
jgi:hypothetical protein